MIREKSRFLWQGQPTRMQHDPSPSVNIIDNGVSYTNNRQRKTTVCNDRFRSERKLHIDIYSHSIQDRNQIERTRVRISSCRRLSFTWCYRRDSTDRARCLIAPRRHHPRCYGNGQSLHRPRNALVETTQPNHRLEVESVEVPGMRLRGRSATYAPVAFGGR
jgi:hypothetical protein